MPVVRVAYTYKDPIKVPRTSCGHGRFNRHPFPPDSVVTCSCNLHKIAVPHYSPISGRCAVTTLGEFLPCYCTMCHAVFRYRLCTCPGQSRRRPRQRHPGPWRRSRGLRQEATEAEIAGPIRAWPMRCPSCCPCAFAAAWPRCQPLGCTASLCVAPKRCADSRVHEARAARRLQ
eukprot:4355698-Prymnesium_polylepis.1